MNVPNLIHTSLDHVLLKAISDFGEGVLVLSLPKIIYTNEAFSKITGYSEKELIELNSFFDLVPEDKKKLISDYLEASASHRQDHPRLETTLIQKNGLSAHIEITTNTVTEGDKTNVVLVVRNITEQKRMATALRQSAEFEKLITTLSSHFINLAPNLIEV
ncbi:MAG TPA: PAS domain S-box protein, partial [bacterium]|nr:PAS domain S-box protein [bacterium]